MTPLSSLNDVPQLDAILPKKVIYLWDSFYFLKVSTQLYKRAEELSEQISRISQGKKTLRLSENSEIVGKVGEIVVREFCRTNINSPWESMAEVVNEHGGDACDLLLQGLMVDVKTRQLHKDITVSPTLELRVPRTELHRYQDIFILAGYCPQTMYGYVLGWCAWEELQSRPIRTDIRFPARCVPLTELHPMKYLDAYASLRRLEKSK